MAHRATLFLNRGKIILPVTIEERQRDLCGLHGSVYMPVSGDSRVGLALSTVGREPLNGLRHPPAGEANGWYIWFGEDFSRAPDFFEPLCVDHLLEAVPDVADFLALPPGYRFLSAGGYRDIWFDANLLSV